MKPASIVGIAVLLSAGSAYAQDELMGKYSGTYSRGRSTSGLELEITSVSKGVVKGNLSRIAHRGGQGGSNCTGTSTVEGALKGDTLRLRAAQKTGASEDCTANLQVKVEGNKLVGKFNGMDTQLSK